MKNLKLLIKTTLYFFNNMSVYNLFTFINSSITRKLFSFVIKTDTDKEIFNQSVSYTYYLTMIVINLVKIINCDYLSIPVFFNSIYNFIELNIILKEDFINSYKVLKNYIKDLFN